MRKEVKINDSDVITGLPKFRCLTKIDIDFANEIFTLYFEEYSKTPTGQVCLWESKGKVFKNEPDTKLPDRQAPDTLGENGETIPGGIVPGEFIPGVKHWTENFTKFNGSGMLEATSNVLKFL